MQPSRAELPVDLERFIQVDLGVLVVPQEPPGQPARTIPPGLVRPKGHARVEGRHRLGPALQAEIAPPHLQVAPEIVRPEPQRLAILRDGLEKPFAVWLPRQLVAGTGSLGRVAGLRAVFFGLEEVVQRGGRRSPRKPLVKIRLLLLTQQPVAARLEPMVSARWAVARQSNGALQRIQDFAGLVTL